MTGCGSASRGRGFTSRGSASGGGGLHPGGGSSASEGRGSAYRGVGQIPLSELPSMHHRSHDQGVCIQRGEGLHPRGRGSAYGGGWADPRPHAGTGKVSGMHPTGMLSFWC